MVVVGFRLIFNFLQGTRLSISNVEYKKSQEWLIYEGGTDLDKYR
jgi:hypothetical protein